MGEADRRLPHLPEGAALDLAGDIAEHQQHRHDNDGGDEKNGHEGMPHPQDAGKVGEGDDILFRSRRSVNGKGRHIAALLAEAPQGGNAGIIAVPAQVLHQLLAHAPPHMAAAQVPVGADAHLSPGIHHKAGISGALSDGGERDAKIPALQGAVPAVGGGQLAQLHRVALDGVLPLPQHIGLADPHKHGAQQNIGQHDQDGGEQKIPKIKAPHGLTAPRSAGKRGSRQWFCSSWASTPPSVSPRRAFRFRRTVSIPDGKIFFHYIIFCAFFNSFFHLPENYSEQHRLPARAPRPPAVSERDTRAPE